MQEHDIIKIEGSGLNCHGQVRIIPVAGTTRAKLGSIMAMVWSTLDQRYVFYWVQSKNCKVVPNALRLDKDKVIYRNHAV